MYNSKFRIDYKNIKGVSQTKYAYSISDLRTVCCDFGCPLSTPNLENVKELARLEMMTIEFPNGYATIDIVRL